LEDGKDVLIKGGKSPLNVHREEAQEDATAHRSAKEEAKTDAKNIDAICQAARHSLQASLLDGSLAQVITSLAHQKKAKQLDSDFQSSFLDSLHQDLKTTPVFISGLPPAQSGEAKPSNWDSLRQDLKTTFQSSFLDGRLSEVLAKIAESRALKQTRQAPTITNTDHQRISSTATPAKPSAPKTSSRPIRRSSSQRVTELAATPEVEAPLRTEAPKDDLPLSLDTHASNQRLRQSTLKDTPQYTFSLSSCSKLEGGEICGWAACDSKLAQGCEGDIDLQRFPSPMARPVKLSRPASLGSALPPVMPPSKKSQTELPPVMPPSKKPQTESVSPLHLTSAMALDLGASNAALARQSAMMLDLGGNCRSTVQRTRPTTDQPFSVPHLSSSKLRDLTLSSKRASSLLPPIIDVKMAGGAPSKVSAHKRSGSVDSFVWGVAPVKSHLERSGGQILF